MSTNAIDSMSTPADAELKFQLRAAHDAIEKAVAALEAAARAAAERPMVSNGIVLADTDLRYVQKRVGNLVKFCGARVG